MRLNLTSDPQRKDIANGSDLRIGVVGAARSVRLDQSSREKGCACAMVFLASCIGLMPYLTLSRVCPNEHQSIDCRHKNQRERRGQ